MVKYGFCNTLIALAVVVARPLTYNDVTINLLKTYENFGKSVAGRWC